MANCHIILLLSVFLYFLEKYKDHSQMRQIEEAAADVGIDHLKTVAQKSPGLELCFATRSVTFLSQCALYYCWEGLLDWVCTSNKTTTTTRNDDMLFVGETGL